eukprot:6175261-Pleurochrysis_carterae.AAC.3
MYSNLWQSEEQHFGVMKSGPLPKPNCRARIMRERSSWTSTTSLFTVFVCCATSSIRAFAHHAERIARCSFSDTCLVPLTKKRNSCQRPDTGELQQSSSSSMFNDLDAYVEACSASHNNSLLPAVALNRTAGDANC